MVTSSSSSLSTTTGNLLAAAFSTSSNSFNPHVQSLHAFRHFPGEGAHLECWTITRLVKSYGSRKVDSLIVLETFKLRRESFVFGLFEARDLFIRREIAAVDLSFTRITYQFNRLK